MGPVEHWLRILLVHLVDPFFIRSSPAILWSEPLVEFMAYLVSVWSRSKISKNLTLDRFATTLSLSLLQSLFCLISRILDTTSGIVTPTLHGGVIWVDFLPVWLPEYWSSISIKKLGVKSTIPRRDQGFLSMRTTAGQVLWSHKVLKLIISLLYEPRPFGEL